LGQFSDGWWWTRGAQTRPERSRRIDVVGVNRADHRVVLGEARWCSTPVTTADLHALMEKGLLWLKGDTARWDLHLAFFARNVGQVERPGSGEENVHLFTPDDVTSANALKPAWRSNRWKSSKVQGHPGLRLGHDRQRRNAHAAH
jgi:hypothetical protein